MSKKWHLKRLASILWWSGQWQSTDTGEQYKALEDSFALRKQEKINEIQDRIDLYGATLRKDSKETIQALEKVSRSTVEGCRYWS